MRKQMLGALAAMLAAAALNGSPASGGTAVAPYAASVGGAYSVTPLLSVGDRVPETSNPASEYQMVGIPDGLGAQRNQDGSVTIFMNHELGQAVVSEPAVAGPLNRGATVSRYSLDASLNVISGERAYDTVYSENTLVGPAADSTNTTPAFARFCSASLAGAEVGFDRPIYLAGEESEGVGTFYGTGGTAVAIFDNKVHTLPKLGKMAWENLLVMPGTGDKTVIMGMEDGPSGPDSQLYMYVGTKDTTPAASVLARNGLDNGKLYTLVSRTVGRFDEFTVRDGSIAAIWAEIPAAATLTDVQLELAVDALGAFGFVRTEDGAWDKANPGNYFFVTTGGNAGAGNELGRLYHLRLNPADPLAGGLLQVIYNADTVLAGGGDTAMSPDNIDINVDGHLMIQEDGTSQSRVKMAEKGRDGSIWRFNVAELPGVSVVDPNSGVRVVTLTPPGRDGIVVGPGVWERSGIIDASSFAGPGSWLFDVQAHGPTTAPIANTVEDGQLLIMRLVASCADTGNPSGNEDGLISSPVHNVVEPVAPVHAVNCEVIVPVEEALGIN